MSDASDIVPGQESLGESDQQDIIGELTHAERLLNPLSQNQMQEPLTNKGEIEKLARFFAEIPGNKLAKDNFFGFLTQIHTYGFYDSNDMKILWLMYNQAEAAFINSVPSWKWTREHTLGLNNVRTVFYSIVRSAIGTDKDVMNSRMALIAMRIQRAFSDYGGKKKNFLGF